MSFTPPPPQSANLPSAPIPPIGISGKLLLGAQLDLRTDSPTAANARLARNLAIFSFDQALPEVDPPLFELIDASRTNAAILLSILPTIRMAQIDSVQLLSIANRCAAFNIRNRKVFLRFAPDFNTGWVVYGQQPAAFIQKWNELFTLLKSAGAVNTLMVWSPFEGSGYPFHGFKFSTSSVAPDFKLLDTNKDNVLNSKDDPYSPYWPGNNTVDWVGLSILYRGSNAMLTHNEIPPLSKFQDILTGASVAGQTDFYKAYAQDMSKPMMISETGIAYYKSKSPTALPLTEPSELDSKSAWWRQATTNTTFLSAFPMIRAIVLEERIWDGVDDQMGWRYDWRTLTTATLANFSDDLSSVSDAYEFAVPLPEYIRTWPMNSEAAPNKTMSSSPLPNPSAAAGSSGNDPPFSGRNGYLQYGFVIFLVVCILGIGVWFIVSFMVSRRKAALLESTRSNMSDSRDPLNSRDGYPHDTELGKECEDLDDVDDVETVVGQGRYSGRLLESFDDGESYRSISVRGSINLPNLSEFPTDDPL
ncbi:hypothetical protein BASA50_000044 [Batrachochytrium salamandrivorans]|uniref:GH26 domain-containing protein n=1 Tax=Batrachochytrium salamandrivorans TaxID=1357716 RepID=A0ABQ8EUT8_9FUNG|nr:hypothetical protein BASA60_010824 [Batrachochytrium salamandrivorans]KAH6564757.1 hypothetical protein BASA62_007729 [Batrachochytrium salamandrivorans]KAH6586995.1 hypothetical protein BASA50_000044 [Batrachochytrium salamandrivorans]KAH6601279.1 hypothetical protein BASA61_002049 [Batrachochytrium salamandrivorans]KAH9244287.1 hypothetical protein BASA81_018321 [Batrachochytrium salamandrivorans]